MQIAKPDTAAVNLATCVYLDLETTGLGSDDEVVALGIVDAEGAVLLDTLVRPQRLRAWPRAEYIHGISPADVARAPTWPDLAPAIQAAVQDRHVVIYNAAFDCRFLGPLLDPSAEIHCCMVAWAEEIGEWSDYWGGYRWHKLVEAAAEVEFDWERESPGRGRIVPSPTPRPAGPSGIICMTPSCARAWQPCGSGRSKSRMPATGGGSGIASCAPAWPASLTIGGWGARAARIGPPAAQTPPMN